MKRLAAAFGSVFLAMCPAVASADKSAEVNVILGYPHVGSWSPDDFRSRGQDPNVLHAAILRYGSELKRGEFEDLADYTARKKSTLADFSATYGKKFIFEVDLGDNEYSQSFQYNFDKKALAVSAFPSFIMSRPLDTPSIDCMFKGVLLISPEIARNIKINSRYYVVMDFDFSTYAPPTVDKFGWRSTYGFGLRTSFDMNKYSSTYGATVISFRGLNKRFIAASIDDGTILLDLPCQ